MTMNRTERKTLIESIERNRESKVLVYITGDRRGLETKISGDIFPMIHKHLIQIGHQKKIDLFIYSTGGITIAGYALVNLIREYCDEFNVIIPFKALSTATLISVGADEIIMTPMAQLSPIDPSVQHPLGPIVQIPGQPGGQIAPVNVEDVNAFIDLAKQETHLKNEESMKMVFEQLAEKIHPLVLGAVQRSREQIAFLASNLMKYHCEDKNKIDSVVKILTRERFSHSYLIGKKESKETLGLNIVEPTEELSKTIIALFEAYNSILELDVPYNPELYLSESDSGIFDFHRGIIESSNLAHIYRTKREVKKVQMTQPGIPFPVIGYQERALQEGWVEDNAIQEVKKWMMKKCVECL